MEKQFFVLSSVFFVWNIKKRHDLGDKRDKNKEKNLTVQTINNYFGPFSHLWQRKDKKKHNKICDLYVQK